MATPVKSVLPGWPGLYSSPPLPCGAVPRKSPMRTATLLPDAGVLHLETLVADDEAIVFCASLVPWL